MKRILLVMPPAVFSVAEVANGYREALINAGHDVKTYSVKARIDHHTRGAGSVDHRIIAKAACETILNEAIYFNADLVLFVCGLSIHPIALDLLKRSGIKSAVIHTESPYQDDEQIAWNQHYPDMKVFTHEKYSAERYGWTYLPHAFNPEVHHAQWPRREFECDVFICGMGWKERQTFLEQVDWSGINLQILGRWDGITEKSQLSQFYRPGLVMNNTLPGRYASAKINLNFHRFHPEAKSLNPRAYEIAACGGFQLTDERNDGSLFARSLPTFTTPHELGQKVRWYLENPEKREQQAELQWQLVQPHTFNERLKILINEHTFTNAELNLDQVIYRPEIENETEINGADKAVFGAELREPELCGASANRAE